MNGRLVNEVRKGFYLDSVALMRLSRHVAGMRGVKEAALMMATPANLRIMTDAGLLDGSHTAAGGGDLIIAISAEDNLAADNALQDAMLQLDKPSRSSTSGHHWRPHTIESAFSMQPDSNLALISVAGDYAAAEASKALRLGMHVLIFSDNVPLHEEVALKKQARELGLLLMGPDCGTAILNGTPLAFANSIPRGSIGIIGASGTGIQEVSCLIARGGGGVSHAIGVGGRDLSETVGGITTLMAMDALDRDPTTEHVVLISKPPSPAVSSRIVQRVAASPKSYTLCFIGAAGPDLPCNATFAQTLKAGAESALGEALPALPPLPAVTLPAGRQLIRGLYTGGSLCAEAQAVLLSAGQPVASNVPVAGAETFAELHCGHVLLDLGDDEYTRGRPHPMIDPTVRDDAISGALVDPRVGVILLDLVLGYGAHENPAQHLQDLIESRPGPDQPVIAASVTGTDDDPQHRSRQLEILVSAGVHVAPSNADATALALDFVTRAA